MDLNLAWLERLSNIVMEIFLHDPAVNGRGYIIGNGVNEIDVRAFTEQVLTVAGREMGLKQCELAELIGSYASNWNAWYRQRGSNRPIEGRCTTWLFNEIILKRSEKTVANGRPSPTWPLRE